MLGRTSDTIIKWVPFFEGGETYGLSPGGEKKDPEGKKQKKNKTQQSSGLKLGARQKVIGSKKREGEREEEITFGERRADQWTTELMPGRRAGRVG